jgi:hypothetical protein
MVVGELLALLVMVTEPTALPVAVGAKVTVIGTDCPAKSTWSAPTPVAV